MSTPAPAATHRARTSLPPWVALVGFVLLAQLAGLVGLPFTDTDPGSWYDQLDKPSFTPPGGVFGPTWTVLYVLVGVAAWRIWRLDPSSGRSRALAAWGVQLVLNALWTPLFFGAELPWIAAVDIVLLVLAIVATIVLFAPLDRLASALLVPYLVWVLFATALTVTIAAAN